MNSALDLNSISRPQLVDEVFYLKLLEDTDELRKESYRRQIRNLAPVYGLTKKDVDSMIDAAWKVIQSDKKSSSRDSVTINGVTLEVGEKGIKQTTDNFYKVLTHDSTFEGLLYNTLADTPEIVRNDSIERWQDVDDAEAKRYIEKEYGLYSDAKYTDALRVRLRDVEYHPIKDIIDGLKWDGIPRIATLLTKWLKCDDSEYVREVSRLIFAGGINRIYNPGCKFDEVPILIGIRQGEGKSTFVRWLAMEDRFFREVGEIDGAKGIEVLDGAWICEMSELLALTKAKEVEAVKSYITRQKDSLRRPYDRRVSDRLRQCIFIGTTNKKQFLTDKTGNRRFYPVEVNCRGYELFEAEEEIKADIAQCWAEAKHLFDIGQLEPYASPAVIDAVRAAQAESSEDDWREPLIEDYLSMRDETCIREIWFDCLGMPEGTNPTRKDSNEIAVLIQASGEWTRTQAKRTKYGIQKVYERTLRGAEELF